MEDDYETFSLPTRYIPYYNIIATRLHRAGEARGYSPEKSYPNYVEAVFVLLRPDLREEVRVWRETEEKKIEEKVWKETNDRTKALICRYDALLQKIMDVLNKTGMFMIKTKKYRGGEKIADI